MLIIDCLNKMRPRKFTPAAIEQIPALVLAGKGPSEIAEAIGCTVSSLRVRCSQLGISLRSAPGKRTEKLAKSPLSLWLSPATVESIRRQAGSQKLPESEFAAALLEAIAEDDLYRAVLDRDP